MIKACLGALVTTLTFGLVAHVMFGIVALIITIPVFLFSFICFSGKE